MLLRLHSLDCDENVGGHVLDLPLLLQSIDYVWNLFSYWEDTLSVLVELIYYFFVVAEFSGSLIYELLLGVLLRCLPSCFDLLIQLLSSVLKEEDLSLVQQLQLLSHVLDLLGHRRVLVVRRLPVSSQVLHQLQSLHEIIQLDQHTNVLRRFIILNINFKLRLLIPIFFLPLLLGVDVSKLLNHSAELHHVDGSAGDLRRDVVLALFSDEVLSDDTEEATHVRV